MKSKIDWLPYFGPMLAFALIVAAADYVPEGWALGMAILRVAAPAAAFLYFFSQGSYPELKDFRLNAAALLDVAVGLGVCVLWIAPYALFENLRPEPGDAFDPAAAGAPFSFLLLALRFAGFALVTPFIEELLVRSFLLRAADAYDTDRDFRDIPIGVFAWRSFILTVAWFTFTHAQWEWPVAFLTGVLYNVWLYRRRSIGALILTHAVTNTALFFAVLAAAERGLDWRFFL